MKTKKLLWLLVPLILASGSVFSLLSLDAQQTILTRGWLNPAQTDESLPFRVARPGVNVALTQYDDAELLGQLQAVASTGATWVRQVFDWSVLAPTSGEIDWSSSDRIVEAVATLGQLDLVAVLYRTPSWARHPSALENPTAPPANNRDYADFAYEFASRYGDRIDYYQIWDQPNLMTSWGNLEPSAADYTALLQEAYTAIHQADATAIVLAAGLAPTTETGPRNLSDVLFLREMYAQGAAPYFDAAAAKPYGFDTGPDDRRVDESVLNFSRIILLREEMLRQGDGEKALWAVEFGWNALPETWTGAPSIWGSQSRENQQRFIQEAYARAEREWPWLGGLIVYTWQPDAPSDDPIWGFALRTQTGLEDTPLPSFSQNTATAGRYHPTTPLATYTGEWEFGPAGADIGRSDTGEVSLTFTGTDFALELRRDDYRGYFFPTIDGEPGNALLQGDDGRSYIILTSPDLKPHTDVIPVAHQLIFGPHIAHLKAELGWDRWALAGFRIGTAPDLRETQALQALSLAILLGSLLAIVVIGWRISAIGLLAGLASALVARLRQLRGIEQFLVGGVASIILMLGMFLTWEHGMPAFLRRDPPGLLIGVLAAGILYLSPSVVVAIAAALFLWFLIYQRLELGLYLSLIWMPFFLLPLELYQYAFAMGEVIVLLTFSAWALQQLKVWAARRKAGTGIGIRSLAGQIVHRLTILDWGIAIFFGIATVTLLWAAYRGEALREWRTMILEPCLFYVMVRTTIRNRDGIVRLADILIVSAVVTAIISMGFYFAGERVIYAEGGTPRMAGVYGSPNNVGLYMERVLPFVVATILLSSNRRRRALALAAGAIMIAAVLLSQSVATILLGIPAGLAVVVLLWNPRKGLVALGAAAVAGLLALIPLTQTTRFANLLDFSSGTSFFRLKLWQSALRMIADHPIQGLGLDQFLYYYRGTYILPEAWQEPSLSHPHNILLDFWLRLGIGGVFWLIGFQIAFWRSAWRAYRRLPRTHLLAPVLIGAMGSMAGMLAHGLVDNSVFVVDLSYVFVLLVALVAIQGELRFDAVS